MSASGTLVIRFIGDVKEFQRNLRTVQVGSASTMSKVAKVTAVGAGAAATALVMLGKKAVELEAGFSKKMNMVQAATNTPAKGMKQLSKLAIKMGADTVFSADEAAGAMLELAKGGMTAAQIKGGALAATLKLAAAGQLDMASAANVTVKAMGAFGLKSKDTATIANALAGAANASSADVSDLSQALAQGGLAAHNAGFSIQETTAALAAFANAGINGSDAGTSLKTFLMRLVPATNTQTKAFKRLGLMTKDGANAFVKANGDFKSAAQISGILAKATKGLSAEERTLYLTKAFGADAFRAANVLSAEGTKGLLKYKKATSDVGAAQRMASAGMKGTAGAIEQLKGSVETVVLQFGLFIRPAVVKGLQLVTAGVNGIVPAISAVAKRLTSGSGGGLASGFRSFLDTAGTVAQKVIGVIQSLIPGFRRAFTAVSKVVADLMPTILQVGGQIMKALVPAFAAVGRLLREVIIPAFVAIMPVVGPVLKFLVKMIGSAIVGALKGAAQFLNGFVDVIVGVFRLVSALVHGQWGKAWDAVKQIVSGALNAIVGALKVWFNVGILAIFRQAGKAILKSWKSLWSGVRSLATSAWKGLKGLFNNATGAISKLILNAIRGYVRFWRGLFSDLFGIVRNGWKVLRSAFGGPLTAIRTMVSQAVSALVKRFVTGMSNLKTAIVTPWKNGIKPIFDKLATLVKTTVPKAFDAGIGAIGRIWSKLQEAAAKPVRFVVNTVYMDGIRKVVNAIPGVHDLPAMKFKAGGPVFGGQRGKDSVKALLMPGEHVWTAREVAAAGGHKMVEFLRRAVLAGGLGKTFDPPARFAGGGEISAKAIERAKKFAVASVGKPYVWGGVGPGGFDCSGFMSAITNTLRGKSPYSRVGATGSFPWAGFKPGVGQFTIGSARKYPGSGVGHMAGTLAGMNVESRGGTGVIVGAGARGYNDPGFNTVAHLGAGGKGANLAGGFMGAVKALKNLISKAGSWFSQLSNMGGWGGLIKQMAQSVVSSIRSYAADKIPGVGKMLKLFDTGGLLMPGQMGVNKTGLPERVLDPQTTKNFAVLTAALDQIMRGDVGRVAAQRPWAASGLTGGGPSSTYGDAAGGAPIQVHQHFPTSADPKAAARAAADRLIARLT